jgi:hypothetical protein
MSHFPDFFVTVHPLGCPADQPPPDAMDQRISILSQIVLPSLSQLDAVITGDANRLELESACGAKFAPLVLATSRLGTELCFLIQLLVRLSRFVSVSLFGLEDSRWHAKDASIYDVLCILHLRIAFWNLVACGRLNILGKMVPLTLFWLLLCLSKI